MTPSMTAEHPDSLALTAPAVEVVPSRQPEGHGFYFKVLASDRLYRLDAARDPRQPRFWCFRISRCSSAGVVDPSERPWYGGNHMTREDLPSAVEAIRSALPDWLVLPQHGALREWVLEERTVEPLPATLRRARPE